MIRLIKHFNFLTSAMFSAGVLSCCVGFAIAGPTTPPIRTISQPPPVKDTGTDVRGRVYLFRGALGPIFSRGMDSLTKKINDAGITANVYEFTICTFIAENAIREYRANPAPITLIGHSMGGFCALKFAEMLQAENIPVSLIVTVDPAHVTPDVPLNVERYINIFLAKNILGGGDVMPKSGYQGHYASYDLSQHDEISHINIDKMDAVHDQIVAKIAQLAATSAKTDSEAFPIRYVVPPDEAVELWDSGMPVFAHAGDTLETIAALYRVPLRSLAQINPDIGDRSLTLGQRIIVPRHLEPLSKLSGQSTLGR
jgi:pimeloyl-ACP methyl ester carboxylesterase